MTKVKARTSREVSYGRIPKVLANVRSYGAEALEFGCFGARIAPLKAACGQARVGQDSVLPVAGVSDSANAVRGCSKGTWLQSSPELSGRRA